MQDAWIAQEHLKAAQPVLGDITYSTIHVFQFAQTNIIQIQILQIIHAYPVLLPAYNALPQIYAQFAQ